MTSSKRWKHRPEGSTWGDYGPDDELGRLNLLTPAKVKEGLAEAREGITFCLSLPLDYPGGNLLNPRRHPPIPSDSTTSHCRTSIPPRTTRSRASWRTSRSR